jgi:multicomponent Na+:H+ antiporter subunit C
MIDMSPNLVLVVTIGVLFAAGVYLVLERSLTRVLIGVVLIGNGANLLFLVAGGAAGRPPIVGKGTGRMTDPLPQAMVLTAIVITLGMTAFLLALAYRSWQLHRHDEVQDDLEDRRIARLAALDRLATTDTDIEVAGPTLDEEAEQTHDDTDAAPATDGGLA